MKGTFKSKDMVSAFIQPLSNIVPLVEDKGLILNFTKHDDDISCNIGLYNKTSGCIIKSKYNGIFEDFELESDCKIGIMNLSEFVDLFKMFDLDSEINIEFDTKTFELRLTQGKSTVVYLTSDPDIIEEFNKNLDKLKWYFSFDYDERFSHFTKAMSVLKNEEAVLVSGDSSIGEIVLSIKNQDYSKNNYSVSIDEDVSEDFKCFYKKDLFQQILTKSYNSVKVTVGEKLSMIECKNDYNETTLYVAKMIQSN